MLGLNWVSGSTQPAWANFAGYVTSDSKTSGVDEPEMKSCSSDDRYVVEFGDSTWMLTLMFGLAFSKALIASCVCWPSVPSPDSANTMVCAALAATEELDPPPELQAAAPAASATAPALIVTARKRTAVFLFMRFHLTTVSNWIFSERNRLTLAPGPLPVPDDLPKLRGHLRQGLL